MMTTNFPTRVHPIRKLTPNQRNPNKRTPNERTLGIGNDPLPQVFVDAERIHLDQAQRDALAAAGLFDDMPSARAATSYEHSAEIVDLVRAREKHRPLKIA